MKTKQLMALVAAMFVLPLNAAELSAQNGISILLVNGQMAEEKLGSNSVDEGFTQAIVKLDDKIGHGASAAIFESKPYIINFDGKGSEFEIKLPRFNSAAEARNAFEKPAPGWQVLVDGRQVEVKQEMLPGKKGFMPYAGMENLVAEHNKQNGIYFKNGQLLDKPVAVEAAMVSTAATAGKVATNTAAAEVTKATKNVEQLKAWYLQADTQERKEFRRWMIDQE